MSSSSPSYLSSRPSAAHRRTQPPKAAAAAALHRDATMDPALTPLPLLQFFLPAAHVRHPADPHRNWIPIKSFTNKTYSFIFFWQNSEVVTSNSEEDGMLHVVSWMECLDLQLLAVLANSTLTSSSEDKRSFYKLKVLFPNSHLEIHGNAMFPLEPNYEELAPFAIPMIFQSLTKFVYFSSDLVVKDCSKRLTDHVNPEVLDAIQRSDARPWVSDTPYEKNARVPNLSVLSIDARKLRKYFLRAVSWWTTVLNWNKRFASLLFLIDMPMVAGENNPALFLTLYHKHYKLSSSGSNKMVIPYDGPKKLCSALGAGASLQPERGDLWKRYLPPKSSQMLGQ
ncbi:hypothetical protein ACJRO7_020648 [Eucalyptus globulus]|uniref:Uncharacterized protein n=1 Tax=Eucalyptus globulus TaxID=34317 RepID=A0ABD3KLR4_EUCGL